MRIALLIVLHAGCIFAAGDDVGAVCGDGFVDPGEACDDGNNVSDDGCSSCSIDVQTRRLEARWTFKDLATNVLTGCPVGYDTAELVTVIADGMGVPLGAEQIDVLDCIDGTGIATVQIGQLGATVKAKVRITNGGGGVYGETLPELVDLTPGDDSIAFIILNDAGYFALQWVLRGTTSGNVLGCSGADEVDTIELLSTGTAASYTDRIACEGSPGVTGGMRAGTYDIVINAKNTDAINGTTTQTAKVIGDRNRVTDLGVIEVPITGL